jgi:hypothetical protein
MRSRMGGAVGTGGENPLVTRLGCDYLPQGIYELIETV